MAQELFKQFDTSELVRAVSQKVQSTSAESARYKATMESRREAQANLDSYADKDEKGAPIAPSTHIVDQNRYIEFEITAAEAEIFGVTSNRISAHDIMTIMHQGALTLQPAELNKMQHAILLMETGTKRFDGYERALTAYHSATEAFNLLSRPAPIPFPGPTSGSDVLQKLKAASIGMPKFLLTDSENETLRAGKFGDFDAECFSDREQDTRVKVNEAVRFDEVNSNNSFRYILDPKAVQRVEFMMRVDGLAGWLLDYLKRDEVPILSYVLRDSSEESQNLAQYMPKVEIYHALRRAEVIKEYVRMRTDKGSDVDRAIILAH